MTPSHRRLPTYSLLCCLLLTTPGAHAVDLARPLAQLEHTAWTERDGAPSDVGVLAQTTDGWLWLGTSHGLWRYDGVRFSKVEPAPPGRFPDRDVYTLHADPDGGLWIGWRMGGISHYRNGVVRNWGEADGLPPRAIWGFAAGGRGLWAAGAGGLAYHDGQRWRRMGPADGYTAVKAAAVFVAADGTVAAFSEQGLFLRQPGAARFDSPLPGPSTRQPPQQRGAGPIWYLEQRGIRALASLPGFAQPTPWLYRQRGPVSGSMLADSAGALWYEDEQGLYRNIAPLRAAVPPGAVHAAGTQMVRNAPGEVVYFMLEDREGSVWISTNLGIHRFRATNVVRVPAPTTRTVRLLPAPGGGVLAAADTHAWHVANDGATRAMGSGRRADAVLAAGGDVWYASADSVRRHDASGRLVERIAFPADLPPAERVYALALDGSGALWVALGGRGVLRHVNGEWQRDARLPGGGAKTPLAILTDSRGRTWFGYADNQVAVLERGVVTVYGTAEGLATGGAEALTEYAGTIWFGGADGLARFEHGRFEPVAAGRPGALAGIVGAVGSPEGLWLNGAAGIVLLPAADLAARRPVAARVFDEADGLRGRGSRLDNDTIVRAADGRIWYTNIGGLFWLDPSALREEAVPAAPLPLHASVDGRVYDVAAGLRLPPHPARVTFGFAAASLAMPARLRYRYRLAGYDDAWQQAGAATEAVYTGLPPGDYRFVVQAVNGAGVPGPVSAPLAVHVPATPVQTVWFKLGCGVLGLLLLWGFYRYRLRGQARRLLALERTRHAERDRIARELHDTLLQSVQGLILRFHAATAGLPAGDPLRASLEATLARADAVVVEARDRVQGLRGDPVPAAGQAAGQCAGVAAGLTATIAQLREEGAPERFTFEEAGTVRALPADIEDACLRIATEALRNAVRHAGARHIAVRLHYGDAALRLAVQDDGRGIDSVTLRTGRAGHYGIAGMRERALEAGGVLEIRADAGQGTVLALTLPYPPADPRAAMAESDEA